jgi:hypothetical protein
VPRMTKRKQDQIAGSNPWEIDIAILKSKGLDPEKARTFTIFQWMYRGDFRPLAWSIDQGHDLAPAVLNLLHDLIVEDRLKLKPRKHGPPRKPDKFARDIIAALAYEAHDGNSEEAFAKIADDFGIGVQTLRQAVTRLRKANDK